MVRNFSEYLKTAKQYEIVRATLEDVIRYNDAHPGVLDRLWQEANEGEHEGIDYDEFRRMIDAYIDAGFNYFDTAHGYHEGASETSIRDCLVKRYPRDRFILTDKLSDPYFKSEADIRPFFEK